VLHERYKNQERILKEQNNVNNASVSYEQPLEIEKLKHTLSEQLKEKESLEQNVTLLTNDFQKKESRNIDRELALEKQTYKQLYDSIKSSRVRSKEQCNGLIKQVNLKSAEVSDLNASLQEKVLVITALKENLSKLKGKAIVNKAVPLHSIDPELLKIYVAPLAPKLRVNLLFSASRSQPQGNTKNDRIQRAPSKAKKNKLEDHHRTVRPSLNKQKSVVDTKAISSVTNSKLNVNADLKCAACNECLFYDNHDSCVLEYINSVNASLKSKSVKKPVNRKIWQPTGKMFTTVGHIWRPIGKTFTLVGNVCPLSRIATTAIVPLREPILIESNTDKPVVTSVYSRKSKAAKKKVPVSNLKINKSLVANKTEPKNSWGSKSSNVSSSLIECRDDHVAKIIGYGDYKIKNVMISRVYFVEGLGHNLFSMGQFCDSDLEVTFRQHTCFIRNLDGVDLLTGSRGNNLYTLSLQDMMASSPSCLLSKASKTKSWLWHRRLSNLNFGAINHLARQGLEKLYLLHMDICWLMRTESVNRKKYILVIVDDYSRFTWVKFLRSKDEAPDFIIKFLKMIQVRLKVPDLLFQPMFDELLNPSPGVDHQAPEVITLIDDVIPQVQDDSTGLPFSTTFDQDTPSPSKSHTTTETQSSVIPQDVEEDNLDIEVAHMGNDPLFGVPIPEVTSAQYSSTTSPQTIVQPDHQIPQHTSK
nr:hypothetical protein [Tanacetum cinerariifolium]